MRLGGTLLLIGVVAIATGGAMPASATHLAPCVAYASSPLSLMPPDAAVLGFAPECYEIESGETLTFASVDFSFHPTGSALDAGACFRFDDVVFGTVFEVTFVFEAGVLQASVNGGPFQDCSQATSVVAGGQAVIPFKCFLHGPMQGEIRVAAA